MIWTIEPEQEGMLIRDYLREVRGFSRNMIKVVKFEGGRLKVNEVPEFVTLPLKAGDVLEVVFPKETVSANLQPVNMPLAIVYEDEVMLVIDKPAGVAVMPSMNHRSGTLANGLVAYYQANGIPYTVHVVTRLDRDTSGLVLIAKHRLSHSLLAQAQKHGKIKRKYQAVMEGYLEKNAGTIHAPIGRKTDSIIEREVREDGKTAVTHYQVIEKSATHTLAEIILETGRTHQIRVHASHLGRPLAGDDLYGGSLDVIQRQALHCVELEVEHPFTGKVMRFTSPLPVDMQRFFPCDS
ncbi:RluA family pseudouridine synthase [Lentibacillus sediminis]|uniref:RluA family pseudouridine synthase n=1 Tax=Lentibacillus sediminis TaxID=1940529 RepID=UPI000C1C56F4|nr:RluA family pseudouridine synthase [Lentibacillus sediminis]